ncbi:MAG: DNA-3-methyladenine glycosylase [Candidatus Margulisbacteria bacterium]|nr:DNA-3-methyladenine glycosylase [Candidatus Margulisiibacteriota bacterium]
MKKLSYKFFERNTIFVAKELLGKYLVLKTPQGKLAGKIVETEAYHENDPASHSYRGMTPRNKPMFGPPGFAYVYFTYGMHYCFNVVTEPNGKAGAVLIRAVEPIEGIALMKKNRRKKDLKILTNGPAKLAQAFGIDKKFNGVDLVKSNLNIYSDGKSNHQIKKSKRIGISVAEHALLRFYIKENKFVSVK